jgi:hypothetical protein
MIKSAVDQAIREHTAKWAPSSSSSVNAALRNRYVAWKQEVRENVRAYAATTIGSGVGFYLSFATYDGGIESEVLLKSRYGARERKEHQQRVKWRAKEEVEKEYSKLTTFKPRIEPTWSLLRVEVTWFDDYRPLPRGRDPVPVDPPMAPRGVEFDSPIWADAPKLTERAFLRLVLNGI